MCFLATRAHKELHQISTQWSWLLSSSLRCYPQNWQQLYWQFSKAAIHANPFCWAGTNLPSYGKEVLIRAHLDTISIHYLQLRCLPLTLRGRRSPMTVFNWIYRPISRSAIWYNLFGVFMSQSRPEFMAWQFINYLFGWQYLSHYACCWTCYKCML